MLLSCQIQNWILLFCIPTSLCVCVFAVCHYRFHVNIKMKVTLSWKLILRRIRLIREYLLPLHVYGLHFCFSMVLIFSRSSDEQHFVSATTNRNFNRLLQIYLFNLTQQQRMRQTLAKTKTSSQFSKILLHEICGSNISCDFFLQRGNISTKFIENNICRIFERIFQIRISGNRDLCGYLRSAIDDLVIVSSNWCRNWRFARISLDSENSCYREHLISF